MKIIDNNLQPIDESIAERYIKLINLSTKAGNIAWKEYITENMEQYVVELTEFNLLAYLCYDAEANELSLYVEDSDYNQYYLYKGEKWEPTITEIYGCMVTYADSEEYESTDFIEDIDYNIEILGKYIEYFKLNVNYNKEILGC